MWNPPSNQATSIRQNGNVITDFRYDTLPHHYKKDENNSKNSKSSKNQPGDWQKPNPARASYVAAIA